MTHTMSMMTLTHTHKRSHTVKAHVHYMANLEPNSLIVTAAVTCSQEPTNENALQNAAESNDCFNQ